MIWTIKEHRNRWNRYYCKKVSEQYRPCSGSIAKASQVIATGWRLKWQVWQADYFGFGRVNNREFCRGGFVLQTWLAR